MKHWLASILLFVSIAFSVYINFFNVRLIGTNLAYFSYFLIFSSSLYIVIPRRKKIEIIVEQEIKSDDIPKTSLVFLFFVSVLAAVFLIIQYLDGGFGRNSIAIILALILLGYLINKPNN
ncbi:MAG: hypothetical protein WCO84_02625 [bacterium]